MPASIRKKIFSNKFREKLIRIAVNPISKPTADKKQSSINGIFPENHESFLEVLNLLLNDIVDNKELFYKLINQLFKTRHNGIYRFTLNKIIEIKNEMPPEQIDKFVISLVNQGKSWERIENSLVQFTLERMSSLLDKLGPETSSKGILSKWLGDLIESEDLELHNYSLDCISIIGSKLSDTLPIVSSIVFKLEANEKGLELIKSYVKALISLIPVMTREEKKMIGDYLNSLIAEFLPNEDAKWDILRENIVLITELPELLNYETSISLANIYRDAFDLNLSPRKHKYNDI